jgi:type IV pilus assembly protein PilM
MQKVIGLDIGSYSIKAVEIVNTFKSYEISAFYENVIPQVEELDPDVVIPACMEQLFKENSLKADRIITAMPGQYISSRVMSFPFSDPRKVETAVMAEIEDVVPFDLDEMIVDHQILGTQAGKTAALVVMTRKNFLRSFLEHLQRINIDPKLVDVDSLAFYNLSSYIDSDPSKSFGLVDIGHEKTSVCIVQGGLLRMFRSINLGGRYLSEFLARDIEVEFTEAQRIKHRVSRVICDSDQGDDLTPDDKLIAERMTLASNAIVKELGRTLYAFKTWEKTPVSQIYLSGGTSRIKNLDRYLQDQLEVPIALNRIDQTSLKINPALAPHMAVLPQSVAIGMRAVSSIKRHSQINLRRGEFAYVQNYEALLKIAGQAFRVVAAALVALTVLYGIQSWLFSREIRAVQKVYVDEFVKLFPDQKKKFTAGNVAFSQLKSDARKHIQKEIGAKRMAVDTFVAENAGSPSLVLLRDISDKMPKTLKVDVTMYKFSIDATKGGGKLVFGGETDSYESVAAVFEALKSVSSLTNVEEKKSDPKPGTDNKVIEFSFNADWSDQNDNA